MTAVSSDHQFKTWMTKANLSKFTVRLKQNGYFSLHDLASARQCGSESFLQSIGMSTTEIHAFMSLRDAACEVFNLHPGNEGRNSRFSSNASSDIIDTTKPLGVTFDRDMKIISIGTTSQVSPQELGRRVVSVGGIIVLTTREFQQALNQCREASTVCELVYNDVVKTTRPVPPPPPARQSSRPSSVSSSPRPSKIDEATSSPSMDEEEAALQAAIEASKLPTPSKPPPEDDMDEELRAAIEASKLDASPSPEGAGRSRGASEEEKALLAQALSESQHAAREAELKRKEDALLAREEELTLRAVLAESEVTEVRGRLASTEMEYATRRDSALRTRKASGAVLLDGNVEVYNIPIKALKLEAEPFARGGGGQIFKGKYSGNAIAAKQVFSNMNEDDRAEFDSEVATLTRLSHPCIMNCYGISEDDNGLFMILEYCGGGDLESFYITPEFTDQEFIRVVGELLSGLSYIHARGIAHRDLKPANVLLEAGTHKVKIADFGLAKTTETTVQRGIGTPTYMPPEMLEEGDEPTDMLAVDVFAIGVIVWQLWFQAVPFKNKSVHKILSSVLKGKRPALDHDANRIPPIQLAALITACWAHDFQDRPKIEDIYAQFDEEIAPMIQESSRAKSSSSNSMSPVGSGGGTVRVPSESFADPTQTIF